MFRGDVENLSILSVSNEFRVAVLNCAFEEGHTAILNPRTLSRKAQNSDVNAASRDFTVASSRFPRFAGEKVWRRRMLDGGRSAHSHRVVQAARRRFFPARRFARNGIVRGKL